MLTEFAWLVPALLIGLAGGVHCAGMCGGIVTALSSPSAQIHPITVYPSPGNARRRYFFRILTYQIGRIGMYVTLGAIIGALGQWSLWVADVAPLQRTLYIAANVLLIGIGAALAGWSQHVYLIEQIGTSLWRKISPVATQLLLGQSFVKALLAGALWGLIPCGMVYSMLASAIATGTAERGALWMAAFGLGTLPNLLLMGLLAHRLQNWIQQPWVRTASGLLVILFGLIGLMRAFGIIPPIGNDPFCMPIGG